MDPPKNYKEIMIAAPTPSFLERGDLSFADNIPKYRNLRLKNNFWRRNTAILEVGAGKNPSELSRELTDLGYVKYFGEIHKGEFFQQGGLITIFPINSPSPITIEFSGNTIEAIQETKIVPHESTFPKISGHKLEVGDYVVHEDHGIGIFREVQDGYYILEYAPARKGGEKDRLLVPEKLSKKISPYIGLKNPKINRLGTPLWFETKRKAQEDILKFAKELLSLYQRRSQVRRSPYSADPYEKEIWEEFSAQGGSASGGDYELTPSQEKALGDVFSDFEKDEPMERLVVGEVGFGKTEVALRTSLRVVLNGKQVALLTPTTVLADQHAETFRKRLETEGLVIERLSRLESKSKTREVLKKLKEGRVDIVVGTHRILSKDLDFKNLGLLIIDEEQRFGVRHKETLKKKYPEVDILYLSATPIPRTLAFSLSKARAMSQIIDPPEGRIPIMTFVLPENEKIIREAIAKELGRGGQIYFLSPRINKISSILEKLEKDFPRTKKAVLHGRMSEKKLVETMHYFREGKIQILVSTTIIENGLDISNVNTLIVEDATRLGLSQAHQLRGRIGRGDVAASAYFLYPSHRLTPKSEERLETLASFSELGAGFDIAKRDLELRGAGNVLGREQSGVMNQIGWNLYFQYLESSIRELF